MKVYNLQRYHHDDDEAKELFEKIVFIKEEIKIKSYVQQSKVAS